MQMTPELVCSLGTAGTSRTAVRRRPLALACAAALALGAFALPAWSTQTQIIANWNGGIGKWSVPSNWQCLNKQSGATVPNCTPADGNGQFFDTNVSAPLNDTITYEPASSPTIDSLEVSGGAILETGAAAPDLAVGDSGSTSSTSGTLTVAGGSILDWVNSGLTVGSGSNAKITNDGIIEFAGSNFTVNGNFAANNGALDITNSSVADISKKLTSTGTIDVDASTLLANAVTTSGDVEVWYGSFLGTAAHPLKTFTISGGTTTVVGQLNATTIVQTGGTITTQNGGVVTGNLVSEGGTTNVQGQTVTLTAPPGEGSTVVPVKGLVAGSGKATIKVKGDLETASTGEVDLTGASTLAVTGNASNDGLVELEPTAGNPTSGNKMTTGGDLENSQQGQIAVGAGSEVEVGGKLDNAGKFTAGACPTKNCTAPTTLDVAGTLANSGTLQLVPYVPQQGVTLKTAGSASNSGSVTIGKGNTVAIGGLSPNPDPNLSYVQSAGSTQVDGELSAPMVDISGGKLRGRGRLDPSLTTIEQGATLSPGDAAGGIGTFTVVGPLDLYGNLDIGIDGIGSFDALDVTGDATFGGHSFFSFALGSDTSQQAGDEFRFFNASSFLGLGDLGSNSFGCSGLSAGLACLLDMNSDGVGVLKLESSGLHGVPEPGSLGMLGLGLGLLGLFMRFGCRRVKK